MKRSVMMFCLIKTMVKHGSQLLVSNLIHKFSKLANFLLVFRRKDLCEPKHDVGVEKISGEKLFQKFWFFGVGG